MIFDPSDVTTFVAQAHEYQWRLAIIKGIAVGCVILLCVAALGILFEDWMDGK